MVVVTLESQRLLLLDRWHPGSPGWSGRRLEKTVCVAFQSPCGCFTCDSPPRHGNKR